MSQSGNSLSLRRLPRAGAGAGRVRGGGRRGGGGGGPTRRRQARVRHLDALAGAEGKGPLQRRRAALGAAHVGTFSTISSHSPREDVVAGAAAARAANADLLVAIGGGSVIDATKAMQLCLWLGLKSPEDMEPHVLPTATRTWSLPCRRTRSAWWRCRPRCRPPSSPRTPASPSRRPTPSSPSVTACSPRARWCSIPPPRSTRRTGCCSARASAPSTMRSRPTATSGRIRHRGAVPAGAALLARALPAIKRNPGDLAPRLEAQFGMWQAISPGASGIPTGASHGIGYALGAGFGVAHGHTSCVMLPAVLAWNAAVNADRQKPLSAPWASRAGPRATSCASWWWASTSP